MPRLWQGLAGALCATLLSVAALQAQAAEANAVSLCMTDFPPFNSPDLAKKGPLVEVATEAFRRSGREVEILFMPWARLMKEAEAAKCVILGMWRSPARDQQYDFSQPIYQMELGYFGRRDAKHNLADPKALNPLKICVQRGAYLSPVLQGRDAQFEQAPDMPTCLRMLDRSRLDLAYGNKATGVYFLNGNADVSDDVEWKPPSIETKDHYLAVIKTDPQREAILKSFNHGLQTMKADGSYKKILRAAGLDAAP